MDTARAKELRNKIETLEHELSQTGHPSSWCIGDPYEALASYRTELRKIGRVEQTTQPFAVLTAKEKARVAHARVGASHEVDCLVAIIDRLTGNSGGGS